MANKSILAAWAAVALVSASPTIALAETGLVGIWRAGAGAQYWRSGMSADELRAQDQAYFPKGFRLKSLAAHGGRFAAVWQPGQGAQYWRTGMTADEFRVQDQAYLGQGLRISSIAVDGGRLSGVWRPGAGAQFWRSGMTLEEFINQDKSYFGQGLQIAALAVDGGRVTAVWRPGAGAQHWRVGMTSGELEAQDQIYFGQGLRLVALATDRDRYSAVWRPGSGAQYWSAARCAVDFTTEDAAYLGQGLRLEEVALTDGASSAYRYPWKGGDTISVGQGNNHPAPKFSHNGVQTYAFDFSMPLGTSIRAARDGVVEWTQTNVTTAFNPDKPESPTNTPFPNGDTRNWGNVVRIRHPGGFTSWYFHIQPGGVLVKAGDRVSAGAQIALSGNVGRTSAPHLHFQVQADSKDWGPTVPISFQNCQVPDSGAKVTSANAR